MQRVIDARVTAAGEPAGAIDAGLLVYLGIGRDDDESAASYLVNKIVSLRIFSDESGKMNRDVRERGGAVLVVSQFTLYGDVRGGRRPGFADAMPPERAEPLYERFVALLRASGVPTQTGVFRADMEVSVRVDGPITILIDSSRAF